MHTLTVQIMSLKKFQFVLPSTTIIAGPSGSGKTMLLFKIIDNRSSMFTDKIEGVMYCYSAYQDIFDKYTDCVTFHKGLPNREELDKFREKYITKNYKNPHVILVLDDLMLQMDNHMAELFTIYSHHHNLCIFFLMHNIYYQHRMMRTISLSTHYFILFAMRRDVNQVKIFASQLFNTKAEKQEFLQLYKSLDKKPYSYLTVEVHPSQTYRVGLRKGIMPGEIETIFTTSSTE